MSLAIYNRAKDQLDFFTTEDLLTIEKYAAGMNEYEILDSLCVPSFDDLSREDQDWFWRAFKRGRALGKAQAVDHLFNSMKGNGTAASLSYLKRFAHEWKQDAEAVDDGEGKEGTIFEVILGGKG